MRGTKAKRLMKHAQAICQALNISPGDGFGKYKTLDNRTYWTAATDKKGAPIMDPENGRPLLQPVKGEGTRVRLWKCGAFYRQLKKYGDIDLRNMQDKGE